MKTGQARGANNLFNQPCLCEKGKKKKSFFTFGEEEGKKKKKTLTHQLLLFALISPGLHLGFVHAMELSKVTLVKILDQLLLLFCHFLMKMKMMKTRCV